MVPKIKPYLDFNVCIDIPKTSSVWGCVKPFFGVDFFFFVNCLVSGAFLFAGDFEVAGDFDGVFAGDVDVAAVVFVSLGDDRVGDSTGNFRRDLLLAGDFKVVFVDVEAEVFIFSRWDDRFSGDFLFPGDFAISTRLGIIQNSFIFPFDISMRRRERNWNYT